MTSIGQHIDNLEHTAAALTYSRPDLEQTAQVIAGWPNLADAAARALLRVPILTEADTAGLFRALVALATHPSDTRPDGPMASMADDYRRVHDLLRGQPPARGFDILHAETLQARLLKPLNVLAEWTIHQTRPHRDRLHMALEDLADHSRLAVGEVRARYDDLGVIDPRSNDPVLRAAAVWSTKTLATLEPGTISTAGLRATLADLNITTATAYYLTKAVLLAQHADPDVASTAASALWEARNEWRIQARQFPKDIRLGPPVPGERNATAASLRATLQHAFQTPNGEWQPAGVLIDTHGANRSLQYARALTEVTQAVGERYLDALRLLPTLAAKRHDTTYNPVFPVGTDLAKVRRDRWLPIARNDPELRLLATRATLATAETATALDAIRETALSGGLLTGQQSANRHEGTVPRHALIDVIATLDAMMPATRHKYGHVDPGSRPAWADGRTPPESIPDARIGTPGPPQPAASTARTHTHTHGTRP